MKGVAKFIAVVASITVLVVPAATMPLHCILMAPSGSETPHQCHMMGGISLANQISAVPSTNSCCQVPAAKPEAMIVPQSPVGKEIIVVPDTGSLLVDIQEESVLHGSLNWAAQSPGATPQAVLCTFLV
jgi:hypothetical protein